MKNRLSRRQFLAAGVAVTGAVLGVSLAMQGRKTWWLAPARWGYHRLTQIPMLPTATPAPLDMPVQETLAAATKALLEVPVEIKHYIEYFDWHAENLPGYRRLYVKFHKAVEKASYERCGQAFSRCDAASQRALLEREFLDRLPQSHTDRLWEATANRSWTLLVDRYLFREILELFARTDVWQLLGYQGWPGIPRGLDNYRRPPAPQWTRS